MSTMTLKPPRVRAVCGTVKGYRAHQKRREEQCEACTDARRDVPTPPTAADIAAEIEWMLALNEGRHAIITALGYAGREHSLEGRLRVHGRHDLIHRLTVH